MEKDNFIQIKNNKSNNKKNILEFIGLIKFISLIIIIRVHIHSHDKELFFAIRACELLFISSGFLVGYNYIDREVPKTFNSAFKYYYKHLRTCYPLYLINFLYGIFSHRKKIKFDLTSVELFIINIFMLQIWSRYRTIVSFYNGISWFLHDLLICYFLTPLLLNGIKSIKTSLIFFIIFSITRIMVEEFIDNGALNIFDTHIHDGPIIRVLEFYLGMLIIPIFLRLKLHLDKSKNIFHFKIIFTIIPVLTTIILYYILNKYYFHLLCCYYVMIFCMYIFIIGYEYGYIQQLISNNILKKIMNPQMEMYLSHVSINRMIEKNKVMKYLMNYMNKEFIFIIKLMIIFLIATFYKKLLKERFSNLMDKILHNISEFIF